MADMMGLFDAPVQSSGQQATMGDVTNGFAGMDLGRSSAPAPAQAESKSGSEDLLGLF
jgi:hypothetical protein